MIKDSVSRRRFLQSSALAISAGAALVAVSARNAQAKIAPNLVAYQPSPKGDHRCDNCALFVKPDACKVVSGDISPAGWCRMWSQG